MCPVLILQKFSRKGDCSIVLCQYQYFHNGHWRVLSAYSAFLEWYWCYWWNTQYPRLCQEKYPRVAFLYSVLINREHRNSRVLQLIRDWDLVPNFPHCGWARWTEDSWLVQSALIFVGSTTGVDCGKCLDRFTWWTWGQTRSCTPSLQHSIPNTIVHCILSTQYPKVTHQRWTHDGTTSRAGIIHSQTGQL